METCGNMLTYKSDEEIPDDLLIEELRKFGEEVRLPIKSKKKSILRKKLNHYKAQENNLRKRKRALSKTRPFMLIGQASGVRYPCYSSSRIPENAFQYESEVISSSEITNLQSEITHLRSEITHLRSEITHLPASSDRDDTPNIPTADIYQAALNPNQTKQGKLYPVLVEDDKQNDAVNQDEMVGNEQESLVCKNNPNIEPNIVGNEPKLREDEQNISQPHLDNTEKVVPLTVSVLLKLNNFFVWLLIRILLLLAVFTLWIILVKVWNMELPNDIEDAKLKGTEILESLKSEIPEIGKDLLEMAKVKLNDTHAYFQKIKDIKDAKLKGTEVLESLKSEIPEKGNDILETVKVKLNYLSTYFQKIEEQSPESVNQEK